MLQFLTLRTNLRCGNKFPIHVLEKLCWFLPEESVDAKIPKLFGLGCVGLLLLLFLTLRNNSVLRPRVSQTRVGKKLCWFLHKQNIHVKIPKLSGLGWVATVGVLDSTNKFALWARVSHVGVGKTLLVFTQTTSSCKNSKIVWVGLCCNCCSS